MKIISDNCGKHFKTYLTHVFISDFQTEWNKRVSNRLNKRIQEKKKTITYHSLGPGDAHNQCDASIAHVKRALKTNQTVCSIMDTINHLAYSYTKFSKKNFHLVEVFHHDFPSYRKLTIPETFISSSYDIIYLESVLESIKCKHNCVKCSHSCCNSNVQKKVYYFKCLDREGVEKIFKIIDEDEIIDEEELASLEETDFYRLSEKETLDHKMILGATIQ